MASAEGDLGVWEAAILSWTLLRKHGFRSTTGEGDHERVKLLLFGEAVNIPKTELGIGVGLLSVWMDGNGFHERLQPTWHARLHSSRDPGSRYWRELDDQRQQIFSNLHGRTVTLGITPTLFVKDGGIARISMTTSVQVDGNAVDKKIDFVAENCKGVSVTTNALSVTCEMLQMEKKLAELDSE